MKKNIELIINSVDSKEFYPDDSIEKESLVLTVGFIKNETLKRKGLETFVRAAEYVPHARFLLIGKAKDDGSLEYLQSLASDNVEFLGFVSDKELLRLYQRAKVYCQLSYYESFGVAVVESMLCECVPVVTNKGALSEVAKDVGFFVTYGDVKTTVSAIKKALVSDKGIEARKRAIEVFSIERREQELKEIIDLCYKD